MMVVNLVLFLLDAALVIFLMAVTFSLILGIIGGVAYMLVTILEYLIEFFVYMIRWTRAFYNSMTGELK